MRQDQSRGGSFSERFGGQRSDRSFDRRLDREASGNSVFNRITSSSFSPDAVPGVSLDITAGTATRGIKVIISLNTTM